MDNIDELVAKVTRLPALLPDNGFCVHWGAPCTPQAIATVEDALNVRIVGSFRHFLLRYGGGGLDTFPIAGIDPKDPLASGVHGVYGGSCYYREPWVPAPLPAHLIVIQRDADDNEPFCLDTSRIINGENPVVLFYHQSTGRIEDIAQSFTSFYAEYHEPYFIEAGIVEE